MTSIDGDQSVKMEESVRSIVIFHLSFLILICHRAEMKDDK